MKKIIFLLSLTAIIAITILGIWTIVGAIMLQLEPKWIIIITTTMLIFCGSMIYMIIKSNSID